MAAARWTTAEFTPIVVTAGLVVAAGSAALVVARSNLLRAFGPALAMAVLLTMAVAVTLVPAVIATVGRRLYWPRLPRHADLPTSLGPATSMRNLRGRLCRLATSRPVALVLVAACVVGLLAAAHGLTNLRLGLPLVGSIPSGTEPARAEAAASAGFAPGILGPTEVVVERPGIATDESALARLQDALGRQPGVAGVVGPTGTPLPRPFDPFRSRDGDAVRYVVVFDSDPFGGTAVPDLRRIAERMPTLLRSAGLDGADVGFAGDTAIAEGTVHAVAADMVRVGVATLLVDFLLLAVFLRSLVAPWYLLGASVLALLATLGIATTFFQQTLGENGLMTYVPFITAVLLVSLGSDYNVFVVGRIWEDARTRPLRDAVAEATPRAARAITVAGLALAFSFALLALVPLLEFRQIAFTMAAGVLVDALVVRTLLVPSLISVVGSASGWPGHALRRR